jgi:O-antigen/teichoic acid export membrane protein
LSVLIFYGKVKEVSLILVATNVFKVVILFVAINYFQSVNYLMAGLSFLSLLQVVLLYVFIPNGLRGSGDFDKKLARFIFMLAAPLAITSIIEKLVIYIDGVMISTMLTTTDFAIYRAGAFEVPFVSALYGSVATIVMPEVAKLFANDKFDEIIKLKRKVISTTAFFVYPVLVYLLFFSLPVVVLYLSDKYSASAIVFAIFNFALLIRVNDYQDIIVISGNSKFIFFSVIGLTILNVILNYVLISWVGINGGAISYIVHLILLAGLLTYKTTRIMSCSVFDFFDIRNISKILLIAVTLSFLIWIFYKWSGNSVYFVVGFAPVYFLIFLVIGYKMELIDESIFKQMFSKFSKKISRNGNRNSK